MKRIIILIGVLAMLFAACAQAESGVTVMNDMLFMDAKQAVLLFEAGDYEGAAELLGFGTAEEFEKFITGNYFTFGIEPAQTIVSVAWWNGSCWLVAVPLHEPAAPEIETLVLATDSIDCSTFCGYTFATWGMVEAELALTDYVLWNEEYIENESMIIYMDD